MVKRIKIGEHNFEVKCAPIGLMNSFFKNYTIQTNFADISIDMYIEIKQGYGTPFQNYDVDITETADQITFQRADYLIQLSTSYKQAKILCFDELALKHAMMNLYSAFIVHYSWGLLIHSSCVIESGKACLFSGNSGAGKSTAAKLSFPRTLLSDEATIVKVTEKGVTVFNSPFRSELEANREEMAVPLDSIQLLHQDLVNRRIALKKSQILPRLIDKVFYWSYRAEETKKTIDLLRQLVESVPAYQLHFQKNNTFWELISHDKVRSKIRI